MPRKPIKKSPAPEAADSTSAIEPRVFLQDVITALQKSFSRVNYRTQENRTKVEGGETNDPTTRLGRLVEFEIALRVSPFDADNNLLVESNGSMELRLKGNLDTDIDYASVTTSPGNESTPAPKSR